VWTVGHAWLCNPVSWPTKLAAAEAVARGTVLTWLTANEAVHSVVLQLGTSVAFWRAEAEMAISQLSAKNLALLTTEERQVVLDQVIEQIREEFAWAAALADARRAHREPSAVERSIRAAAWTRVHR
jgi:hypothetical protein